MEPDDGTIKAVEKVLKEPVAAEFGEQAWRIRTNLTIVSAISVVMSLADLRIAPDSSVLGLKFAGLNDGVIRVTLATIVAYFLFHFLWVAWDAFLEWRLRVTGTRSAFQTGSMAGSDHADYPGDPRQSTLYNWWVRQQTSIGNLDAEVSALRATCKEWQDELIAERNRMGTEADKHVPGYQNVTKVAHQLGEAFAQITSLQRIVGLHLKAKTDPRIPVSLKRFDDWFQIFLRSQNLRWFVVELTAPIVFAVYALYLLQR